MKRLISTVTGVAMLASAFTAVALPQSAEAARHTEARQVEYLTRGLIAIKVDNGVYLSWRLLGHESLDLKFDIYKNGQLYISGLDSTNYTDNEGFSYDKYQVVPAGTPADQVDANCVETEVWAQNYYDLPLNKPASGVAKDGSTYSYSVNDASVADLDGDGELEYIIKWDPSNSQDNSARGYTGRVLIDAYKFDGTQLWRIDLGQNIRAGAHYTQFIVYDFDGDGKAEMAVKTAPGSIDGQGTYVNEISNFSGTYDDNKKEYVTTKSGKSLGHIITGEEYLTMFEGETGKALCTIDYTPERGSVKSWGDDSYGNRSERYLAAVAYLNGKTPSLIECRGYYQRASMTAYNWDGTNFIKVWQRDDRSGGIYGQGNHNLSVCDADNDGMDEIVFGSAIVDQDGEVLNSTGHGHGDALHVSDFNNDGNQEVFQVHEETNIAKTYGAEYRDAATGNVLARYGIKADVGRGCMDNIDDEYASANADGSALFWHSASANLFDTKGNVVKKNIIADGQETTVEVSAPGDTNFFIYWDGDLSRELLDKTRIDKYTVENGTERLETFAGVHSNNGSKSTPALSGDLFGDWREEVAFGTGDDTALRIYTTTDETEYKLTTLLHDTQYREAIAWQNVGYNQPPHLSYYVGSSALASGKNYLAPNAGFDSVYYVHEPALNTQKESSETMLYSSSSFNNGYNGGFDNISVSSESAPYNSVARANGTAELDLRSLFDESYPTIPPYDPNSTPAPTPTPAPTAVPTYINDFTNETVGTIMQIETTEQTANTAYSGMELYIGNRDKGDGQTTYWAISTAGNPGNCLQMHSGKYTDNNRGPRVKLLTPEYSSNNEVIAMLDFKVEVNNALYYNDNTAAQATNALLAAGDGQWHTLKIVIANGTARSTTRYFYIDDNLVAQDSASQMPVLWGTGVAGTQSSIYFDNYSVRVEEVEAPPTNPPTNPPTSEPSDKAVRVEAVYNTDGTIKSVNITEDAEITDETPGAFTKVFYWNSLSEMKPLTEVYSGSFEQLSVQEAEPAEVTETVTETEPEYTESEEVTATVEETEEIPAEPQETEAPADEDIIYEETDDGTVSAVAGMFELAETAAQDGTYKIAFDWKPGSTVKFEDENGNNIITLEKPSAGSMTYKAGTGEAKSIHSSLTNSSSWYHVEITIDLAARNLDLSVMDYTNNSAVRSVYAVSFSGADGYIAKMSASSGSYLDNVRVSSITYNVPMTLFNFNVESSNGTPLADATVKIGTKSLTTDENGHTAVKMKSGEYSYYVTKSEYKSASSSIVSDEGTENIDVTLADGEQRNIYITYKFGDVVIKGSTEAVATAKENSTYTVSDEIKAEDITYTFTTDPEEITPGYEAYMGQTYTFEYDADNSSTVDVVVAENADTYITLSYKIKRVPTAADTEVLDVNFGEDGYGKDSWSANSYEYVTDETYGIKYAQISGLNSNSLTVNIPEYDSDNVVIEFDISYKQLNYGGNYYGVTPYSGSTAGQGFGLRTSRAENTQWQWCYRLNGDNYLTYVNDDKAYSYEYNWKDRWAHVVMVSVPSENKFNVSIANKDSGYVYIQDADLPMSGSVGGTNHITKLVFSGIYGSALPSDVIGLANLKVYTIGAPQTPEEITIDVHDGMEVDLSSNTHVSDYEGMDYSVEDAFSVTYEIQDENGAAASPAGLTMNGGTLVIAGDAKIDTLPQYYVAVKYSGTVVKRYKLHYLSSTLTYGTIKGFDSGETDPFSLTSANGFSISNADGTMLYKREIGTGVDAGIWLTANITNDTLADNFIFSYDFKIDDSFLKGYMYLQDGSGNNIIKGETHFDEPRIKFSTPKPSSGGTSTFGSDTFKKAQWYTFVFRCTGFTTSDKKVVLDVYNKGDYDYNTNTATADPVWSHAEFVPEGGVTNKGLVLKFQSAQGSGKQVTDNGDWHYFDNMAYYYYVYK